MSERERNVNPGRLPLPDTAEVDEAGVWSRLEASEPLLRDLVAARYGNDAGRRPACAYLEGCAFLQACARTASLS